MRASAALLLLCVACDPGGPGPQSPPVPTGLASLPAMRVELTGHRMLRRRGEALLPIFDAASPPVLRVEASGPVPSLRVVVHEGANARPLAATTEARDAVALLRVPTLPSGSTALTVQDETGRPLQTFELGWDEVPEARAGLAALRRRVEKLPPADAARTLEAELPTVTEADRLWLAAEVARAWARTDTPKAVAAWRAAAEVAQRAGAPTEESRRLRAAAWNLVKLRDHDEVLRLLDRASAIDRPIGNHAGLVRAGVIRTSVLEALGELREAADILTSATSLARSYGLDADWASGSIQLAWILSQQGLHTQAHALIESLAPYYAAHPEALDAGPRFDYMRGLLLLRAIRAGALPGPLEEARAHMERSHAGFVARANVIETQNTLVGLTLLELTAGRLERAAEHLAAAERADPRDLGYPALRRAALRAELKLARGRGAEALAELEALERRARAELTEGFTELAWQARFGAARARLALGRRAEARRDLAATRAGLRAMANRVGATTGHSAFVADRRAMFDLGVDLALGEGDVREAFLIADEARVPALRAMDQEAALSRLPAEARAASRRRMGDWMKARDAFEARGEAEDTLPRSALARWRAARAQEAQALAAELDAIHAAAAPREEAGGVPALAGGEALLAVHATRAGQHVFWLRDGAMHHEHTTSDPAAVAEARMVGLRHVYVVVGGFGAGRELAMRWAGRVSVSLLSSAAHLLRTETAAGGPPLVLADPDATLPSAREEGAGLAALLGPGTRLHAGDGATRSALWAALPRASVFHFAGHGVFSEARPWETHLRLAGAESLTVADVLALRPAPGLVVLSGCETGRSAALPGGEGARPAFLREEVGLAEAFLAGGARTVLAALSPVDDARTARFVRAFYERGGVAAPAATWRALATDGDAVLRETAAAWRVFGRP